MYIDMRDENPVDAVHDKDAKDLKRKGRSNLSSEGKRLIIDMHRSQEYGTDLLGTVNLCKGKIFVFLHQKLNS